MGAVYLARDTHAFDRPCVIKEMLDYYDQRDPQARTKAEARFREEGRILASLSHPGIPKIYAFFQEEGRYFIVMEYIQGENLASYVTQRDALGQETPKKPLSEEEILGCAIQACGILAYLADQPRPVVHQDVKPANLIRERIVGDVRLVDFGTAWSRHRPGSAALGHQLSSVYGTMGYAAPEQCHGRPVPKSDVYSLAATIYHLLTDDDPRDHPGQFAEMGQLRSDLRSALELALRPDPHTRSSARQLGEHLESIVTPQRALGAFGFPGGERIRGVSALPAMCDKHWEAARGYLYNGDFQRWLRDLNRLDLAELAQSVTKRYPNQDQGLEAFLRTLDPGLPRPKLEVTPWEMDLGHVAREESIPRQIALWNGTRGAATANVSTATPWIRLRPPAVELVARASPVTVSVSIRTRDLPLRGRHQGAIQVDAGEAGQMTIPVWAHISLWREAWRDLQLGWRGAAPLAAAGWRSSARWLRKLKKRLDAATYGRLRWFLGGHLAAGVALGVVWWAVTRSRDPLGYLVLALVGPPALIVALTALTVVVALLWGTLAGAARGLGRTFKR